MTRRAAIDLPDSDDARAAVDKYEEFHRFEPHDLQWAPATFRIPSIMYRCGSSLWVAYRSNKIDPATLRRPRGTVDYIHDHDAGVVTYVAHPLDQDAEGVEVPRRYQDVESVTRLGDCLGFSFKGPDGEEEATTRRPMPELYTVPDGRCLLVIERRRQGRPVVAAMMWGGALGVFARGIDG